MILLNLLPREIIDLIIDFRMKTVNTSLEKIQTFIRNKLEQKKILLDLLDYSQYEFEYNYTYTILKIFKRIRFFCEEETERLILIKVDCYYWYDYDNQRDLYYSLKFNTIKTMLHNLNLYFNTKIL